MDYAIFRKQVYRRTGGQRDSLPVVTDSIQREIDPIEFPGSKRKSDNFESSSYSLMDACRDRFGQFLPLVSWPSLYWLLDLHVMVLHQVSRRVVQLRYRNLKIYL